MGKTWKWALEALPPSKAKNPRSRSRERLRRPTAENYVEEIARLASEVGSQSIEKSKSDGELTRGKGFLQFRGGGVRREAANYTNSPDGFGLSKKSSLIPSKMARGGPSLPKPAASGSLRSRIPPRSVTGLVGVPDQQLPQ